MSEKMTRIRVPGTKDGRYGYLAWGEVSREEVIRSFRAYADSLREKVARIDATPDEAFEVDVVRGSVVQKHIRSLPPTPPKADDERSA